MSLSSKFMIFWVLVSSLTLHTPSYAQNISRYAYAYQSEDGVVLMLVNPETAMHETIFTIPGEVGSLSHTAPSNGQEWIALVLTNGQEWILALLNVTTQEFRQVPLEGNGLYISYDKTPEIVWSPDGRYLALNFYTPIVDGSSSTVQTYLYTIEKNVLSILTELPESSNQLAWSSDGQHLVVGRYSCPSECRARLEFFNITTNSWVRSISIPLDVAGAVGMCNLDWSPDNRYLSFVATCDPLDYAQYREVYLVDVAQQNIRRLTEVTYSQDIALQQGFRFAEYHLAWLHDASLLISSVGMGEQQRAQTALYRTKTGVLETVLSGFVSVIGESKSGSTIVQIGSSIEPRYGERQGVFMLDSNNSFSLLRSDSVFVSPEICALASSPDGLYWVYLTPRDTSGCEGYFLDIHLLQPNDKNLITSVSMQVNEEMAYMSFIGWVSL